METLLIRPAPDWTHWDPAAEKVHRIPLATVIRHGRDVVEVATQLNERLSGLTLYCDGWAHDYVWLSVLFDAAGLTPAFKLDNLRVLLTDKEAAFWAIVKKQITTYRTMRVSRKYCEATFRELCDIYKLEKIGIRVDTSKYLSAIGKVQYAKLNNGRLKKGFRIIAEQLLKTSQNENSKILHRLIVGGEKAVMNDDTH